MANEPTKPASGTWAGDASALLAMGARDIGSATVRGLVDELREAEGRLAVARTALRFYANDLDNLIGEDLGARAREALQAIGEE